MPAKIPWQERLNAKLVESEELFNGTPCWIFTGALTNGYGSLELASSPRTARTHRLTYENNVGPIPKGMQIDHLCRNRACCNPDHLEVVTPEENVRRGSEARKLGMAAGPPDYAPRVDNKDKETCPEGHTYDSMDTRGKRYCSVCRAYRDRMRYLARVNRMEG